MTDQAVPTITDTEIESCAERIAGWAAELTPGERVVFEAMVLRAAAPRDDVSGYAGIAALLPAVQGQAAQDRMGNFEIQRLMSAFNQAETLASSVQRKLHDTNSAIIGKI